MKPPLRIAILECDTPLPGTKAKFGGYGGVFVQLFNRAADALKHPDLNSKEGLIITKYHVEVEDMYPEMEDIDAIVLTGSKYNAFDDVPWILKLVDFTKKVLAQDRVQVLGVCFGHQIVGRALGQRVCRGEGGWEISVTPMKLTQKGKEIFQTEDMSIYQMHKDIVDGFPGGVESLGATDIVQNHFMYAKGRLLTVQGHPEFTQEIVKEILETRHRTGVFTDEMFEDAMSRLTKHDDGVVIAQTFLRLLLEE